MADDHKARVEQNSSRIVSYLMEHRAEFEQGTVTEDALSSAVGLSEDEVREAVDHLESHDDLARSPKALSKPPQFVLKPARGWRDIMERASKEASGASRE